MGYKVYKQNRWQYVSDFDVETYVRSGFDLYKESYDIIDDVENEYSQISERIDSSILPNYWARKNDVMFKIQPYRMLDFYNRGYEIIIKTLTKITDIEHEIENINQSDSMIDWG